MDEDSKKRLEELQRKKLEAIHHQKMEETHRKQLKEMERKRAEELQRKRQRKSSQALLTENILKEIDSTLKKSRTRPAVVIVFAFLVVLVLANYFVSRGHDFPFYLNQIKPEMTYAEVRKIVPAMLILRARGQLKGGDDPSLFAYLLDPDVKISSYMQLGYRGLFPKEDTARIFFDSEDKVVGIDFSLEKGGWVPSWGDSKWNERMRSQARAVLSAEEPAAAPE